jgi:hypothetical protein
MSHAEASVPGAVRAAGVLVGVQGLAGLSIAAGLVALTLRAPAGPVPVGATAAWLGGFGALLLAVGAGLLRGRHGARAPAIVAQLLLLGVSWYAAGPSHQLAYGVAGAAFCLVVLILLLCPPAVRWAGSRDGAGAG